MTDHLTDGRIYISGLFKGRMPQRKREAIKEVVSAAVELDRYMRSHPEVFRRHNKLDGVRADDGTSPYDSLWRLKDAVAQLTGDR